MIVQDLIYRRFQALLKTVAWCLAQHGGDLCGKPCFLLDPIAIVLSKDASPV